MYEYIIKEYINKLTLNDIKNVALNENIILNDNDTKIIYDFIKANYNLVFKDLNLINISELKPNLDKEKYDKICMVYNKYKEKFLK